MTRVTTEFKSSNKYRNPPEFSRQYTNVYYNRLQQLRQFVVPLPSWTSKANGVDRVLDLETGKLCWIVGTITRESVKKPNILEDLKKIYHGQAPQHALKYCTPMDKLFLEDEHGRIELVGDFIKNNLLITGTVIGLLGSQNNLGEFEVLEQVYPQPAEQPTLSPPLEKQSRESKKIALISGLLLDDTKEESLGIQLMFEYLAGAANVSRLIICGNSLNSAPETLHGSRMLREETSQSNLQTLDDLISTLSTLIPVHVMPGESDPAPIAFPQTPMHPALFQKTKNLLRANAMFLETNPLCCSIDGVSILGNSGQPIKDLSRYTDKDHPELELDLLYKTLQWRHIAPTAPDTLCSFPYVDEDPLVIMETPHVYFAGNCSSFHTAIKQNVRLICVPEFNRRGCLVLLDLETLDVEIVELGG